MLTRLRPTARVVLMELAALATHDGYTVFAIGRVEPGQVWTSTRRLAMHVGMSKTTIRRALRQLVMASKVKCEATRQGTLVVMTDDERQMDLFAAERPPSQRGAKSAHQRIVAVYFEVYEKLYGQKPRWSPQQGKTLKGLIEEYGPDEVEKRLRLAAEMWSERQQGKALTFGAFARNFDAFVRRPARRNAFAAWEALVGIITKYGFSEGSKYARALDDKAIWATVEACGGWHYVCHTSSDKIRRSFFREYKGQSQRE